MNETCKYCADGAQCALCDVSAVCADCCGCVGEMPALWSGENVVQCDCGSPMLPNVSTWTSEDGGGCGWICFNPACGDYSASELEPDDLVAVGVPEWVAHLLAGFVDALDLA